MPPSPSLSPVAEFQTRQFLRNGAEADQSERLAAQLHAVGALPAAFAQLAVHPGQPPAATHISAKAHSATAVSPSHLIVWTVMPSPARASGSM